VATCGGWGWRQPSDPASVASRTHRRATNRHATALPQLCHAWRGGRQMGGSRARSAPLLHPVAQPRCHPHVHEVTGRAAQAQAATATCSQHTLPTGTWASPGHPHTDAQSRARPGALPATAPPTAHVHGHGCTRIISSQHWSHCVPTHSRTAVLPAQSDTLRHTATSHTCSEQRCHACRCF